MLKVTIPENIPSLNKGEAAILEGIREMLSLYGQHEITLYSPDSRIQGDLRNFGNSIRVIGGIDLYGSDVKVEQKNAGIDRFLSYIVVSKLLVFALLSRILGRMVKHMLRDELLLSILDADIILAAHDGMLGPGQIHIGRACRIMKKPIVLCGSGMGSANELSPRGRRKVRFVVNNSIGCIVRDKATYDGLKTCQADEKNVYLASDPAVLLPPCDDARVNDILESESIPRSVRRSMCAVITAEGGIVAKESFSAERDPDAKRRLRVELWKALLTHLVNTTDAYIVFLPHCIGPSTRNDDRRMARDIYDVLTCEKERIKCIEKEYAASELKGIMKHCQLVLSERAHAAIGAFSAGTPCVGFAPKQDSRMYSIINDMFHRPVCDLDAPDMSQIKTLITDEWNNRQQTSIAMAGHVDEVILQAREAAEWMCGRIAEALCRET